MGVNPSGARSSGPGKTWKIEATPPTRASSPSRSNPAARAARRRSPCRSSAAYRSGVMCRSVARPAAAATGLPLNVPPWTQRARPARVELGHHVLAAAERAGRVAAADDLAERRQVRPRTADPALGAVRADPERDHLVEDQQGADPVGEVAQEAQELGVRDANAAGALDRLDDDCCEARSRPASARSTPSGSAHGSSSTRSEVAWGTPGVPRERRVVRAVVGQPRTSRSAAGR